MAFNRGGSEHLFQDEDLPMATTLHLVAALAIVPLILSITRKIYRNSPHGQKFMQRSSNSMHLHVIQFMLCTPHTYMYMYINFLIGAPRLAMTE